jgi:acetoin utilization deacetylase AcuC-like enzyme
MSNQPKPTRSGSPCGPFALVLSEAHASHRVRDRGYVERPERIGALVESVSSLGLFVRLPTRHFSDAHILAVHDRDFVRYLKEACETLGRTEPIYPYVFPIRRQDRQPRDLDARAGYYCIDTFTPLDFGAYQAARGAVDVALTAADAVLHGRPLAYALCRPPGHHAERRVFGGFCYFNNAAVATEFLSRHGRVAVLDIDYHHGNGTQDIFYERPDVLTVSIHADPSIAYPHFSGFTDERGAGAGIGHNWNFPLPEHADEALYLRTLAKAARLIERAAPAFLVVSLGLDTMARDQSGSFTLRAESLRRVGERLGRLRLPTLVVQEGGYHIRNLRRGGGAFFAGMAGGMARSTTLPAAAPGSGGASSPRGTGHGPKAATR